MSLCSAIYSLVRIIENEDEPRKDIVSRVVFGALVLQRDLQGMKTNIKI
jgi:hypothetical protein